ncbi:Vacuolar membrane protein [Diplonema papillatum]|nr:Vacuolar membrane protein [Diplonema papillatum]|eukprot:gene1732-2627_t
MATVQEDVDTCRLLSGRPAMTAQLVLLVVAGSLLVYKNAREGGRTAEVFVMDTAKQGVGALCGHMVGMTVAITIGAMTDKRYECGWYLVTFVLDTTLGTFLTFALLRRLETLLFRCGCVRTASTGVYPSFSAFVSQTVLFALSVSAARCVCAGILFAFRTMLLPVVTTFCAVFEGHPVIFLAFVMLVGPGCFNSAQFWVQDNLLQRAVNVHKKWEDVIDDVV